MWNKYHGGATVGQVGSENGTIILDEEHIDGARITLEQNCRVNIPYAVTAGIYGIMVHTVFAANKEEAGSMYKEMKLDIERAFDFRKRGDDRELGNWIEVFCDK